MGTSKDYVIGVLYDRDHPHAYGDKLFRPISTSVLSGSSPRVWGQVALPINKLFYQGIIPTRMGTSCYFITRAYCLQDHPHAYGDKSSKIMKSPLGAGSSPRVWGQVRCCTRLSSKVGIIPTRMGTRLKESRKIAVLQNQPLRFPLTFHRSFV